MFNGKEIAIPKQPCILWRDAEIEQYSPREIKQILDHAWRLAQGKKEETQLLLAKTLYQIHGQTWGDSLWVDEGGLCSVEEMFEIISETANIPQAEFEEDLMSHCLSRVRNYPWDDALYALMVGSFMGETGIQEFARNFKRESSSWFWQEVEDTLVNFYPKVVGLSVYEWPKEVIHWWLDRLTEVGLGLYKIVPENPDEEWFRYLQRFQGEYGQVLDLALNASVIREGDSFQLERIKDAIIPYNVLSVFAGRVDKC